jgi:hypothetical protein
MLAAHSGSNIALRTTLILSAASHPNGDSRVRRENEVVCCLIFTRLQSWKSWLALHFY